MGLVAGNRRYSDLGIWHLVKRLRPSADVLSIPPQPAQSSAVRGARHGVEWGHVGLNGVETGGRGAGTRRQLKRVI
jgi:hypothetical protein